MFLHPEIETEDSKKTRQLRLGILSTQFESGGAKTVSHKRLYLFRKLIEAAVTSIKIGVQRYKAGIFGRQALRQCL